MSAASARHARDLTGAGGLLDEAQRTRPTLARREARPLTGLARLRAWAAWLARAAKWHADEVSLRRRAAALAGRLRRHRWAQAGLLQEAVASELGVAD